MDATDGQSRLLAAIGESICHDADIDFVVSFGSRTTGESRPSSEIDLAIKFDTDLDSNERFRKRCFLSGDLQRADGPFVDVSDIESLPIDIAHDAVNGEFICGDEQSFRRFKGEIEATFEDRREDIRRHQQEVIDRIAREGLSG